MLKQVWIAECDLCGKVEKGKTKQDRYNDTTPCLPDGWKCGHNKDFHLCPECAKLAKERNVIL